MSEPTQDPLTAKVTSVLCGYLAENASSSTLLSKFGWNTEEWREFVRALVDFELCSKEAREVFEWRQQLLNLSLEKLFFKLSWFWPGWAPGLHIQSEAYIQFTQDVRTVIGTVMATVVKPTDDLTPLGFNPARRNFFGKELKLKNIVEADAPYELLSECRTIAEVVAAIRPHLAPEVVRAS